MKLIDTIQDIAAKVTIKSELRITHPEYKPFELPKEAVIQFSTIPEEIRKKYLSFQLRSFLYGIYYNASLKSELALSNSTNGKSLQNNTFMGGVDLVFYKTLHENNLGHGIFEPGWEILQSETDGVKVVRKGELTLYIEPEKHLQPEEQNADVGEYVAILLPKNRFMGGFYVAVGDVGHKSDLVSIARIYLNLKSEGAPELMKNITEKFNHHQLPFTFKVLYNPTEYVRADAGVLYFKKENFEDIYPLLCDVYQENYRFFKTEIPLFTKFLAPGLGLAEEPNIKFMNEESFGLNRCQIVTNGLIEAWEKGLLGTEEKVSVIVKQFDLMGIELEKPYLNPNSEDIYTPLNL